MVFHVVLLAVVVLSCTPLDLAKRLTEEEAQQMAVQVEVGTLNSIEHENETAVQQFTSLLADLCEQGPDRFEYEGVSGACSLTCGERSYTGPVDGLGYGADGVTVTMHVGGTTGPIVVAKLFKRAKEKEENLGHECNILKTLENAGVQNILTCADICENNGFPMIIVEPFLSGRKSFIGGIQEAYFVSAEAARKAAVTMMQTAVAMLSAGVANIDQGGNMLFSTDGKVTFIDMGMAANLRTVEANMIEPHVRMFVDAMLAKIPFSWWTDGRLESVMNQVSLPTTPHDVVSKFTNGIDLAKIFVQRCVYAVNLHRS